MAESLQRILYLEDDSLIAELAMMALQELGGFTVSHCCCGRTAIEAATNFAPQLLLFDVMLPEMDGPETFDHIKRLPALSEVPVIFMTAKAQKHQEEAYLASGARGVILKPFDPLTLSDQIQALWSTAHTSLSEPPQSCAGATG